MKYFVPTVFVLTAIAGLWLVFFPNPLNDKRRSATPQARVVSPKNDNEGTVGPGEEEGAERMAFEDASNAKISLASGESVISVLTQDFDGDPQDEQVIALKEESRPESPIRVVYADFDENTGAYQRVWEADSAATKPRTFSVFVKDLIGDRSFCIVATGMNEAGEQTITAFRKAPPVGGTPGTFSKIAELQTDGSVSVIERDRSQAYQMGIAAGASFRISTYGRDYESSNLLDQIETTYDYDPTSGKYERSGVARIPGAQVEQRRVRQLLDGTPERFVRFLDGLWQYSSSSTEAGAPKQFILFDPQRKEVIFSTEDTQEVFSWENSSATRYGLYLTTKNISVTTLRRLIDIELESVDSIRVKVFEDVKLKIGVGGRWDGTYRKAGPADPSSASRQTVVPRTDAAYVGSDGNLRFYPSGRYEFTSTGTTEKSLPDAGTYAFFSLEDKEFLELRKDGQSGGAERSVYQVERSSPKGGTEELKLVKVRIGIDGAENLHEKEVLFRKVDATKTGGTTQTQRP